MKKTFMKKHHGRYLKIFSIAMLNVILVFILFFDVTSKQSFKQTLNQS